MKESLDILIADDEHMLVDMLSMMLESFSHNVIATASTGDEAVEYAAQRRPDIAILDIAMPGRDGLTVAKELWESAEIPCLILSAYSTDEYLARSQEAGVFGYLVKPVQRETLKTTLNVVYRQSNDQKGLTGRVDQLERMLSERRMVEQAKWMLVSRHGMSEPDAHAFLQREARGQRRRLVDVAGEVIRKLNGKDPESPKAS